MGLTYNSGLIPRFGSWPGHGSDPRMVGQFNAVPGASEHVQPVYYLSMLWDELSGNNGCLKPINCADQEGARNSHPADFGWILAVTLRPGSRIKTVVTFVIDKISG